MLTRFVRTQLILFTAASVIGLSAMAIGYLQVPRLLGVGHISVTLELPSSGGLYQFSNVTYRGVQVGTVTDVKVVDGSHVQATLSLDSSPKIPADLHAQVRSVSAVGEQYVDLQPIDESPPFLSDGSVISIEQTSVPQKVGPMLDQLNDLVGTIPKDRLNALLDESFTAFNGAGFDFGSLLASSETISQDLNSVAEETRSLIDDSAPLLDSQVATAESLKIWANSVAGITEQVVQNDSQLRNVLQVGPGFTDEVSGLLNQVKPTLPLLLANLTSVGQVLMTYNKSLEQLLVLLPPYTASLQAATPVKNPTGLPLGDFAISVGDPSACTVGFLPPSQWRSPGDTSEVDTPDGLYCKLPQDSPIAVRGARNYPCIEHPGKRAATVQECDSDKPFVPLAMRQHVLGPYPFDPNLVSQGVPLDARVAPGERISAPVEGTPLPPGVIPTGTPPGEPLSPLEAPLISTPTPPSPPAGNSLNGQPLPSAGPPAGAGGAPGELVLPPAAAVPPAPEPVVGAAPSSFGADSRGDRAVVSFAQYNPESGAYMGQDGNLYKQRIATSGQPESWTDLMLSP